MSISPARLASSSSASSRGSGSNATGTDRTPALSQQTARSQPSGTHRTESFQNPIVLISPISRLTCRVTPAVRVLKSCCLSFQFCS